MALDFGLLNTNAPAQIAGAYGRGQQEAQANLLAEQQLQHAQNQNALSKYQIDAARMQNEQQNALNTKYSGVGFDPMSNDTHLRELYGMGAPGRAQAGEILKYRADQRKAEQESFNVASKRYEIYKQEMGALSSDPDLNKDKVIATFDNLVSNGLMPQTMRDTMVSKLPNDPVALKASALQDAKSTLKGKDLLTAFLPELMVAGGNVINKNPLAPSGAGAVIAPVAPVAPAPTNLAKLQNELAALQPGDPRIPQYNALIRKETTHAPAVSVSMVSERAEQGARGKMLVDQYGDISKAAGLAVKTLPAIESNLSALNKGFDTGFGKETVAAGASVLAALGVKDAEKFATDTQKFQSNAISAVLQKQLEQKGPQTESDAKRIEQIGSQLGKTKDANTFILATAKEQLKRDVDQRNFYDRWYKANKTYDGAEDAWFNGEGGQSLFARPSLKKYNVSAADVNVAPAASNRPSLESIFKK